MRYERMTKAQLIDELRRRDLQPTRERNPEELEYELGVYEQEVKQQQLQLMEAREEIEVSRDRYADLYDFAPVAYITLDPIGLIREINLVGARLLGSERARILRMPFHHYVHKPERRMFLNYLRACRSATGSSNVYLSLSPRTGEMIPVQLICRRARASRDEEPWLYMAINDLTDIKRAEAEIRKSEHKEQAARATSEAKDRFLAMLSHELRTPLTPIVFGIQTLQSATDIPARWATLLAMMQHHVELEARLIDDLLEVTRILQGKLRLREESVDMHAAVRSVVEAHMPELEQAGLSCGLALGAERYQVRGDSTRLHQVIWNFLRNAIKATPPGGRITIRSMNEQDGRLILSVSDTGIGIASDMLERIFLPFEQADGGGSGLGLGLTICKGLVEAHAGQIRVSSRGKNEGATFEVELRTEQSVIPALQPEPIRLHRHMRILLVEDHVDTAELLSNLLSQEGHEVQVAHTLGDARAIADGAWDLCVTDIGLPDGSGLDLVRELRMRYPVKAIALSGYGSADDILASKAAGCSGHLVKPANFQELIETIERVAAE